VNASARRTDDGAVVTVTFTRDNKLNAIGPEMFDLLEEAVADLETRHELRVLLITAEGRYFTSGVDISTMDTGAAPSGAALRRYYRRNARHDLFDRLEAVEKPVVIAAQGPCVGVGVELAASCDFRLASRRTTFSLPEIANLAVIPGSGGVSRLTRLVGPHWAKWLVMAGQVVTADHALAIGLVHTVYPDDQFAEQARAFASHLAALPADALGVAKLAIDAAADVDRRTARDIDRIAQTTLLASPDHLERVAAFNARRPT
jgi:enoyl-CoA hydratase